MAGAVDHFVEGEPGTPWFTGTCNTLKASRWTVTMARFFGRRVEGEDMGHKCVGYWWRGRLYLTSFKTPPILEQAMPEERKP